VLRALGNFGKISGDRSGFDPGKLTEIRGSHVIGLQREPEAGQAVESAREMVDGIVGYGDGTVSALVADLEAKIDHVFFADLQVIGDLPGAVGFSPPALVQREFGINEVAVVLEQPIYAVERAATFFIRGERDDDVAVGLEAFAFIANQVGDPDGGLRLVITRAAAVEVAILLDKLKRVCGPVFALSFDYIGVGEKKNRLRRSSAVVANHQVRLFRVCSADKDIGIGKSRGLQAGSRGLGYRSGGTGSEPRLDLYELFIDIVGQLLVSRRRHDLGTQRSCAQEQDRN